MEGYKENKTNERNITTTERSKMIKLKCPTPTQQMIDDNTIGIGELDECELKTYEDVQGLTSEIIHTLQDEYEYLKPQAKSTAGNVQGDGVYNWSAHEVIEELIMKRFNIEEE